MRFRRGTPYRKFGSESNLLVTSTDNKSEQIYNCSQCGHEGIIKPDAENRLNNSGMSSQHQTSLPIRMDVVNDLHSSGNSDVITKKSDMLLLRKSLGSLITTSLSCVTSSKPNLNRKFLLLEEEGDCDVIVTSDSVKRPAAVIDNNQSWAKITRREEVKLREASWYQPGLSREIATEILSSQSVGAFMVRCSNTSNDSYALSVKIPRVTCGTTLHVAHYLILASLSHGYRLKGSAKTFPTLGSLIVHHSVMQEILPCTLNLKTFGSSASASPRPVSEDGSSDSENSQELADINEECPELIFTLRKALSSC